LKAKILLFGKFLIVLRCHCKRKNHAGEIPLSRGLAMFLAFAFPVIETVTLIMRKLLKGRSPLSADREHFHHLLQAYGLSQRRTVLFILVISTAFAVTGLLGEYYRIPEHTLFYGFVLSFVIYFLAVRWAWIRLEQREKIGR
jgi:UDP-GlcNAc:undecaprenyl-phosphate GlcNAc-1-phosphate transferase